MSGKEQELHCLICQVFITQAHLGIDSCRACAVFYKRTLNLKRPLKCRGGAGDCLRYDPTTPCRKCRFARFKEIFDRACAGGSPEWQQTAVSDCELYCQCSAFPVSGSEGTSEKQSVDEPAQSYLDHNSFFTCEPSCSDTPYLDRMKRNYSMLCLVRKSGEIGTLSHQELHTALRTDEITPRAAKYSEVIPNSRIFFSALIDFARLSFDDFRLISPENRHFIVYSSFRLIQSLDLTYRAFHHFPNDDTIYMTYINKDTIQNFLDDCPFEINRTEAIEEFNKSMTRTIRINKSQFRRVRPSGDEFIALVGLSLFSDAANISDELLNILNRNRAVIMSELHKMYTRSGLADYAARLGDLLCLLVNVERVLDLTNEDLQVYRMMNLFNEAFGDPNAPTSMI